MGNWIDVSISILTAMIKKATVQSKEKGTTYTLRLDSLPKIPKNGGATLTTSPDTNTNYLVFENDFATNTGRFYSF